MIPNWLQYSKYQIQQLPSPEGEDFFDNTSFDSDTPQKGFLINNSLEAWQWLKDFLDYQGTAGAKLNKKRYLQEQMGLVAIEINGQEARVYVDPVIYRKWYETEFENLIPMQLENVSQDLNEVKKQEVHPVAEEYKQETLTDKPGGGAKEEIMTDKPKDEISGKNSVQSKKGKRGGRTKKEIQTLTDMPTDETPDENSVQSKKGGGAKKRKVAKQTTQIEEVDVREQKMEEEDSDFEQPYTAKRQRSRRPSDLFHPVSEQSGEKKLTISPVKQQKLERAASEVFEELPLTFKKAVNLLKDATALAIRPIKKSEYGYITKNYMVNIKNKANGLEDIEALVANKGYLKSKDKDQYYYVLVTNRDDVIGHLVFYHNKAKNETSVKVPAFEVDLTRRGMRLGELLMLVVMDFCVDHNVRSIRLETGHHENSGHLAKDFTQGMRKFYCKLGFRLEGEDRAEWDRKNLVQKLATFQQENDQCEFDFSEKGTELVLDEAQKALFAYKIKDVIESILEDHVKYFKKLYNIHDLLSCKEYTSWLIKELSKSGLVGSSHIETALILISNEKKSKDQIRQFDETEQKMKEEAEQKMKSDAEANSTKPKPEPEPPKDYGPLLAAIPKSQQAVEQKEVATEEKAKTIGTSLQPPRFHARRRSKTPQVEETGKNTVPSSNKTI